MGDRCYLELIVAEVDLPEVEKLVGKTIREIEDGIAIIKKEGANCAWVIELKELAGNGIPFEGWNGIGVQYGAGEFCGVGGRYYKIDTVSGGCVNRCEKGTPESWSLLEVRQYKEALMAADRMIHKRAEQGKGV